MALTVHWRESGGLRTCPNWASSPAMTIWSVHILQAEARETATTQIRGRNSRQRDKLGERLLNLSRGWEQKREALDLRWKVTGCPGQEEQ